MSGCINKERYMRRCYNSVLGEYYYIDILRERLRCQQEWIKRVHLYYRYKNVYKKVEVEIFKEKPIICLISFFYFLPIKILNFFTNIKKEYIYNKALKEIEVIQREIENVENNKLAG